jgi:hypothetical protein
MRHDRGVCRHDRGDRAVTWSSAATWMAAGSSMAGAALSKLLTLCSLILRGAWGPSSSAPAILNKKPIHNHDRPALCAWCGKIPLFAEVTNGSSEKVSGSSPRTRICDGSVNRPPRRGQPLIK